MRADDTAAARAERLVPAAPDRVFDLLIDPDRLAQIIAPSAAGAAEAQLDAREGGLFRIVIMTADGEEAHYGMYLALERPRRLRLAWMSQATLGWESQVEIELAPEAGGTRIWLIHEGLPSAAAADRHAAGWARILGALAELCRGG